jgi:hypothetical protein
MDNGADQLTELERVKLENFALKHNALQHQSQANLMERAAFIRQIEAAHPGYRWNDQHGLVKVEAPAPAPGPVPVPVPAKGNGRKPGGARIQ